MFWGNQYDLSLQKAQYYGSGEEIQIYLKDGEQLAWHLRGLLLERANNKCSKVCVFEEGRDVLLEVFANLREVSPNVKKRLEKAGKSDVTIGEMIERTPKRVVKYLKTADIENINSVLGKRFGLERFWRNTNTFTYYRY